MAGPQGAFARAVARAPHRRRVRASLRECRPMELVVFYLIFCFAVGVIANARGRSGVGWALLSLVISPLIAVVIVALIPSRHASAAPVDLETAIRNQQLAN